MHYEASFAFDNFFLQFMNCLKPSGSKQFLKYLSRAALITESFRLCRTLATHRLNIWCARSKLSTQRHTSIGRALSAFPALAGGFSARIQGPCWGACKPGHLRTRGPSPSFGSCFHAEALAPPSRPHRSHVCTCSCVPLTLSLTHRPIPRLHLRSGSSLWTCWELPRLWLTLVTISGPDPLPQLMVPIPDSPWEAAQPCLLALPLSSWLACPRRAACPRCPLTHGLPTDQVSSSDELIRTLA